MILTVLAYPKDFPQGVPPKNAQAADGIAYRVVVNNPPKQQDFCGYYREPFQKKVPANPPPNFFGTSMYRKYESIKLARDLYKNLRGKKIAKGTLSSEYGVISAERHDSHFEAWLKENCGIENNFEVLSCEL
jgi:hypothetical protein